MKCNQKDLVIGLQAEKYFKSKKNKNQSHSKVMTTLLVFTANWCETCVYTYTMWVNFANRFTTQKLQVVEVDTSKFETIARQFKVNFKDGNQLPSLVLLEDNKEYLRFPPVDYEKGTLGKVLSFKEKELIKYFDLDKRFLATQNAAGEGEIVKKKAHV